MEEDEKAVSSASHDREGAAALRPRARIIQTLGRDLISNEVIAIQELIKNAYDADATKVELIFHDPLRQGDGAIVISDNGIGMNLDTIKSAWMEPATVSKTTETRTSRGRRVTGEKGIGRFAAARIADVLELATIPTGSNDRIRVRFDWAKFEDPKRYLDEVQCSWSIERVVNVRQGTTLALSKLKDDWTSDRFVRVKAELARLVAPLNADEFSIFLTIPGKWKEFGGQILPPEVLGKPHYQLKGQVQSDGTLKAEYSGPDKEESLLEQDGSFPVIRAPGGAGLSCGPFQFEFRVWDRQKEDLEPLAKEFKVTLRDIQRDLSSASGINVYRDNFRVLIPENDWLRLDLRRVQNPTLRLSNNQIVGRVFISADQNPGLKDQTNRQGIIDSSQLDDFKAALKDILARLEVRRDNVRRGDRTVLVGPSIFERLKVAPIKMYLVNRYPSDREMHSYLDEQEKQFEQGVVEVQKVLARYRRLATLGQLIDVVLHEGRTPLSTIKNEVALAEEDLGGPSGGLREQVERRLHRIADQAEFLTLLFKRLAPFSGRKRGKPINTSIEDLLQQTFDLHDDLLRKLHVDVSMPQGSHPVTVDPAEMQMIFVNLLENAMYWLEKVPENERQIQVAVSDQNEGIEVIIADSGPGVAPEARDRIFEPYFSMKPEGVGLGLTIAGETAAEYDGGLELLADGPLRGATFRVFLRKRTTSHDN